jgi:hypothetical protein
LKVTSTATVERICRQDAASAVTAIMMNQRRIQGTGCQYSQPMGLRQRVSHNVVVRVASRSIVAFVGCGMEARRRAALSLVVWLSGGVAFAQAPTDREMAKALQVEGLKLLDHGDAGRALEKFTAAYSLVPSPRVLFNLGRAHFELGQGAEAYECFDQFLAEAENVPPKSRADAELMRSQLRTNVALLQVAGPAGAVVSIDRRNRGRLPLERPLAVAPGTRTVTVQSDEKILSEKQLHLVEATTTRLVVEIAPAPAPAVALTTTVVPPSPSPPALVSTPPAPVRPADQRSILGRWWFWAAATAVIAAGVVGVAAATGRFATEGTCPSGRICM